MGCVSRGDLGRGYLEGVRGGCILRISPKGDVSGGGIMGVDACHDRGTAPLFGDKVHYLFLAIKIQYLFLTNNLF